MNKKMMLILGGVAAVLLVVILFVVLSGDRSAEDVAYGQDPSEPRIDTDSGMPIVSDDPAEVLEDYLKWAKYPPTTRPLHEGMVDLIDPFNPDNLQTPIGVIKTPAQCSRADDGTMNCTSKAELSDVQCKLVSESSISIGRDDFKVFLNCYRPGPEQKNLPVSNLQPKVYMKQDTKIIPSLPPVGFGDEGTNGDAKAGDALYTFLVRPTANDWGPMYLEVSFEVEGLKHVQRTNWYSTPHKIADFTGNARDSLDGGHLKVSLPINVVKAGYYIIRANLQEKEGGQRFVAAATYEGELDAGAQVVDLIFFGKVIRDSGVNGPYVVREIRGLRDNSPVNAAMLRRALESGQAIGPQEHKEPLQEYMKSAPNHTTQAYNAKDFSEKEWESEEKNRRVNYLKSLISQ